MRLRQVGGGGILGSRPANLASVLGAIRNTVLDAVITLFWAALGVAAWLIGTPEAVAQTLTVKSPNTIVVLDPGSKGTTTATIQWSSNKVTGDVTVDLSRDGGSTWSTLFTKTKNDGSEVWPISGAATKSGLIRVRTTDSKIKDQSDAQFVIWGPYYKGQFIGGYCTAYAAAGFDAVAPSPGVDWTGNAGAWFDNAKAKKWKTTTNPADAVNGAAVVWTYGTFGHVARVRGKEYDAKDKTKLTHLLIDEMNWGTIDTTVPVYRDNAISVNFGKVTTDRLPVSNLSRGKNYAFKGIILPQKTK